MQLPTIYCPRCGAVNDPQMPYCVQCGTTLSNNSFQVGSGTVVQNNALIPPPPPPVGYSTVPSVASTVPAYPFDPYTQPAPQKKRGINPLLIAGILVALMLVVGIFVVFMLATNGSTSTVKYTSALTYPKLAPAYAGNVHNNTVNITSAFTLTNVVEDAQGNISGNALIGSPLTGSGPFKGSVGTDKSIQFTITPSDNSGTPSIRCIGTVQTDGSLSGTYTIPNTNETGTWQAK